MSSVFVPTCSSSISTLPGRGGLEILRQLREQALDLRILVLTSHNELEERVQGLREGADDYLGKPFAFSELMARVEALLRRGQPTTPSHSLAVLTWSSI